MSDIDIIERADSFLLISDGKGRFAVVESRNGHVYSIHGHDRREAPFDEEGMRHVVGDDGWFDEDSARQALRQARGDGETFARVIW